MNWLRLEGAEPDRRLEVRYKRLSILIALPMFVLVTVLAGIEFVLIREHALQNLSEKNAIVGRLLEDFIKQSETRLRQLSYQVRHAKSGSEITGFLRRSAANLPFSFDSLPEELRTGYGQLLWNGNSRETLETLLARFEHFSHVCQIQQSTGPDALRSYWRAANGEFIGTCPWLPAEQLMALSVWADGFLFEQDISTLGIPDSGFWLSPRQQNNDIVLTHVLPINASENAGGLVAIDWPLSAIQSLLAQWSAPVGRLLIIDRYDTVLADSAAIKPGTIAKLGDLGLPDFLTSISKV